MITTMAVGMHRDKGSRTIRGFLGSAVPRSTKHHPIEDVPSESGPLKILDHLHQRILIERLHGNGK
jgi:hypothetical protein